MFDKDKAMRDFEKDFEHYKKEKKNLYGLINEVDEFRVTLHLFRGENPSLHNMGD